MKFSNTKYLLHYVNQGVVPPGTGYGHGFQVVVHWWKINCG